MPQLCFYFQLHQPYRLGNFSLFDISQQRSYFADENLDENKLVFQKVAAKSYLPMLTLLGELLRSQPQFTFALSCSGIFLEQALTYQPQVIDLLQQLVKTGRVEILAETYYHSLASLYSPAEFKEQVRQHALLIKKLFGVSPRVFRNTELIYANSVGEQVAQLGFMGMLTEAVPRYLHDRSKTQLFQGATRQPLLLLLKHAELSDDIAFRFSDKSWVSHPLSVEKYLEWLEVYGEDQIINLFMDFETFGEHQWESTGIFEFFRVLIERFTEKPWNHFVTPSQVFDAYLATHPSTDMTLPVYDVPHPISWADIDRDLTAWTENAFQRDCLRLIYELSDVILESGDVDLVDNWRRLQTSDHFYYMCTKWAADGDVHAYFSPYQSPFEAYRRYAIVLADLQEKTTLKQTVKLKPSRKSQHRSHQSRLTRVS